MKTVAQALHAARRLGVDRLDAQLLLGRCLERPRTWLIAHDDAALDAHQAARFDADLRRRADGVPLAYLLGEKEFHGLLLEVDAAVLVPRPDTELLVDWALACIDAGWPGVAAPRVLDLGTGSGAIALAISRAIAERWPQGQLTAVDRSAAALAVAARNAARHAPGLRLLQGSWWAPLGDERFHLVVSNPPYIAARDPHLPALRHEPTDALVAAGDGLAALSEIVAGAPAHLEPGGWLLLEHGHAQAPAVAGLLVAAGFDAVVTRTDLAGLPRATGGRFG